jgi:hypothetical protein
MRQPSKGSVIMLIVAPVIGCLLLWYVVFPLIDDEGPVHDLLAWKTSKPISYAQEGTAGEEGKDGGGFSEIQLQEATTYAGTKETSTASAHRETRSTAGNGTSYKVNSNESHEAGADNSAPVVSSHRNTGGGSGGVTNERQSESGIKFDAAKISSIASAAEQVKGTGEKVKQMIKGTSEQSKTSGGGGGLLLLPPDDPDPLDVPLDGGLTVLVAAVLGYGVRKSGLLGRKKTIGETPIV